MFDPVKEKDRILAITDETRRDIEIAMWSYLSDYSKAQFPTRTPKVVKYYEQPKDVRDKMNKRPDDFREFWNDPEVAKYFEDKGKIESINYRNLKHLRWMKEILGETDVVGKIDVAIATHIDIEGDKEPEVKAAIKVFGGNVVRKDWE